MFSSTTELRKVTAGGVESGDDGIYEDFEAPKFFDFSVPEKTRPDDRYWFCSRIGCDQKHEEIDPDALKKNFILRVMEARSPNVRFQNLHNRHGESRIPRCPRTAPAKSTKDGDHKSAISTIRLQKIKSHPISSLRSTPITKPRIAETPSSKTYQPCEEKTSRVVASTNSASANCTTTLSEMCSGMSKLKIGNTNQISRQLCKSQKSGGDTRHTGLIQPKSHQTNGKTNRKIGKNEKLASKERDDSSSVTTNVVDVQKIYGGRSSNVLLAKKLVDDGVKKTPAANRDHKNKENNAPPTALVDIANKENDENHGCLQKVIEANEKTLQIIAPDNNARQLFTKMKSKVTNPKPFRFRTDERGVLREANFEKKLYPNTPKETSSSITPQRRKYVENNNKDSTEAATWRPYKLMKLSSHSAATTIHHASKKAKEPKNTTTTTSPWNKKPLTIPKEPRFHKIHMPKCCARRIDGNSSSII